MCLLWDPVQLKVKREREREREERERETEERDREKERVPLSPNVVVGDGELLGALYEHAVLLPGVECFRHSHAPGTAVRWRRDVNGGSRSETP